MIFVPLILKPCLYSVVLEDKGVFYYMVLY